MSTKEISMRDAFGDALLEMAERFPKMVVLDADVATSTKTLAFGKAYPERFFNVGVAEANMTDIAGGMATCGLRPVVSAFAIFLGLKCTDQIRNVLCYNNLPVTLVGGYCGLSDSFDGASHQSITDIAIMRAMPNMTVVVPADAVELGQALGQALEHNGPVYVRISRNEVPVLFENEPPLEIGKIRRIRKGGDITIGACGSVLSMAIEAADILVDEGISAELLEISTIKPIDTEALVASVSKTGKVLTVEEHNICGGLGSAVAESLGRHYPARMDFVGIEDTFTESGPYDDLLTKYKISVKDIVEKAKALCG